jgi:acetyl-CoA carboxylase biotin carboxyl carrier protein
VQLQPQASAQASVPAAPAPRAAAQAAEGEVIIRAPMLGTFYRASSPGEKAFVEVGQKVKAGDSVGVIEVMKLFNSIQAGVDGTVVRIEVENASLVEFDQALIVIAKD